MDIMKTENEIIISIIMPVADTPELFLKMALDSIIKQKYKNYELLCVDDCSVDQGTLRVLDIYEREHEFIHVIRLSYKMGAAEARNIGLKGAKGTYVMFLDSDDLFCDDLLERMYQSITSNNADVCVCGFDYMSGGAPFVIKDGDEEGWLCRMPLNPWTKMCRKDYLVEHEINFQNLTSSNDVYYSCMVLLMTDNICTLATDSLIHYRTDNIRKISNNRDILNLWKAIEYLCNELKRRSKYSRRNAILIDALLLESGIIGLREDSHFYNRRVFYEYCRKHFLKNKTEFTDVRRAALLRHWLTEDYESEWMSLIGDFGGQLDKKKKKLKEALSKSGEVYVWGIGKRGDAFIRWCDKNDVNIKGVCDRDNRNVGKEYIGIVKIVHTEDVLNSTEMIVATNQQVKDYLDDIEEDNKREILNLQDYCDIG